MRLRFIVAVFALFTALSVSAASAAAPAAVAHAGDGQPAVTHHTLDLAGGPLNYTATAGFLPVLDEQRPEKGAADRDKTKAGADSGVVNDELARVFVVSYVKDGAAAAQRPVTFVFNGGPGAASAYMHLGAAGPRILAFNDDGSLPPPPVGLRDNPNTWLRFTDLVFIDPVDTGFSRQIRHEDDARQRYFSVDGDARYLSDLVRLWLVRNDRWDSPKFLAGESYGGFRIIHMARDLQEREGITVNGLVMVSPLLDQVTVDDDASDLLSWAVHLPVLAAIARHYGRGDRAMDARQVETYALGDYLSGLAARTLANPAGSADLIATVSHLTGLPMDLVARYRGEIPIRVFAHEVLHDQGKVLSIYDGEFTAPDPDPAARGTGHDPLLDGSVGAYATGFNRYVRDELGFHTTLLYRLLDRGVNNHWDWGQTVGYNGAIDDLQTLVSLAPDLRVLVAHGRFDMVTPWLGSRWLLGRLVIPAAARDRIHLQVYDGGHMLYMHAAARAALSQDVQALVAGSAAGSP